MRSASKNPYSDDKTNGPLRVDAFRVNTDLCWYNISDAEMKYLETADILLLRKILNAPRTTPIEMLFLELGLKRL